MGMVKRLVDIDDDSLERARRVLGTGTMKATVNRALQEVIDLDRRRRFLDRVVASDESISMMTRSWIMPGADPGRYLIDKSALATAVDPLVGERLRRLSESGLLATCSIVDLEVLYSARSSEDCDAIADELAGFEHIPIDETVLERARSVQRLLASIGQHRLSVPDLIIAAAAEANGATVLHYDRDFERISAVTGQAHECVAALGSIN
jgi:predicted nucleic acid-binding protein